MRRSFLLLFVFVLSVGPACRRNNSEFVTVALPEPFSTFDTLTTEKSDAAAERVRGLIFNSLIRKNETFDYVGELASDIKTSEDGKAITLTLRDAKFQNGKQLTSTDVKYTMDELFRAKGYKSFAFFETEGKVSTPHIVSIETPDPRTVVFNIQKPALKNQLLSNLVTIPIIPEGSAPQQKTSPVGSGPFKFVGLDSSQNVVELAANTDYWEGAPQVQKLRIKTVSDASSLQAELQTGGVDIAPNPSNMPPDAIAALKGLPNLSVEQFPGSNIQYIGLNTQSPPLDNVKVRQAIGYGVDREKIIRELLGGQAAIANSILPQTSWAYSPGTEYKYDPAKAKQLLQQAGYKGEPVKFKYASGQASYSQYSQAIQSSLTEVGLNIQIETLEAGTLRSDLAQGRFQMSTGVWIGGNQDPIFLRDLFTTTHIPSETVACCNRSRYSNSEVDKLVHEAVNEPDRERAKELYVRAWQTISNELPLLPLWYPANIVVVNKRIGNIKISPSGDWGFLKDITVNR